MITQNKSIHLTGTNIIINELKNLGIDTIFGYPGAVVLELYNEIYKSKDLTLVLVRHEQAAIHAVDGYSRTTGKCGVALVTSGPGATNTITGIYNAYMDGTPLIVITGQVSSELLGKNSYQETKITDMVKSCTKAVFQITSANQLSSVIKNAHKIATEGKKGPVLIDITQNAFSQIVEYKNEIVKNEVINTDNNTQIQNIYSLLKSSKYPLIISGGGVKQAKCYDELAEFSNKHSIPVVTTMMGVGTISKNNPNYLGMIGICGDKSANNAIIKSDLIIALGVRFNDRVLNAFKQDDINNKIIQINIDKDDLSKTINPLKAIKSDVNEFLSIINNKNYDVNFNSWLNSAKILKYENTPFKKISNELHAFEIFQKLNDLTIDKEVIFTSEIGQHLISAIKNISFDKTRQILISGGSGTMGFGLSAAIGSSVAYPDKTVVCITGDGSFQMSLEELAVCKDYGLNIKILIINNGYLGMVRQLQEQKFNSEYYGTKISSPDFVKLAQSYNIEAENVSSLNEAENAINRAFSTNQPYIINFETESYENI